MEASMKKLRVGTFLLAVLLTVPALAADPPAAAQKDNFEKRKSIAIERIDREIGLFQGLRACVAAANDREDMQKCREKFKEAREAEKAGRRRGN
jgi:hypothetical protein